MATTLSPRFTPFNAYTLTTSYVAQTTPEYIPTENVGQITLEVEYTMGAAETANTLEFQIQGTNSRDPGTNDWFNFVSQSVVSGTSTLTKESNTFANTQAAGTADKITFTFPLNHRFMRVLVKESGVAANAGTLTMHVTTRNNQSY